MTHEDYWKECISIAADECDLILTNEQLSYIADAAQNGHEHYGMAFYSPPPSDRIHDIEREWKAKFKRLQTEFDNYQKNAETAVKRALNQYDDACVSIEEHGNVFRHDGRIDQIQ